nr:MAG TPA: Head Tail Connector Protein [Caudoviricetes sp.]
MGYTTFEFYESKYYGDSIEESLFPKWESRASDKLNQLTCGHINEDTLKEFDERIQKATCALADLLYQIDFKTSHASDEKGGNVKSMSSGGRSISFGTNETLIDKVLNDKVAQNRLCYDTVCEYLSGTGLLYAGV